MMRRLLTPAEAAAVLRIPETQVMGMVADGELTAFGDGDNRLIAEASLREFMDHAWVVERS